MSDDSSFGWYDWLYLFICCLHHCSSCAQSLSIFHLCCPNHADAEECREFSTTMRKLQCSYCFCLCPVIYRSCWLLEKTLILEFCFYKISGNHATCFLIVNNPTACIHSPAEIRPGKALSKAGLDLLLVTASVLFPALGECFAHCWQDVKRTKQWACKKNIYIYQWFDIKGKKKTWHISPPNWVLWLQCCCICWKGGKIKGYTSLHVLSYIEFQIGVVETL